MLSKSKAIVLSTTKYLGNMLLVKLYTEKSGQQSFIIRNEKKKRNVFMPFSVLEIDYDEKENRSLHKLKETNQAFQLKTVYLFPDKSAIVLFMAELVAKVVKEEEGNPELFQFLEESILKLDSSAVNSETFHLFFILGLSRHTGFYPSGYYSPQASFFDLREGKFSSFPPPHPFYLEGENAAALGDLKLAYESGKESFSIKSAYRRALLSSFVDYFRLHLPGMTEMKSHLVLQEI